MGLFRTIRNSLPDTPLHVLVRSRPGRFVYSEDEIEVMRQDILEFKSAGAQGVVIGILTTAGDVDVPTTTSLAASAAPLQVTFHRAIDDASDYIHAFKSILTIPNITRILTSGGAPKAVTAAALENIALAMKATNTSSTEDGNQCSILPGSGINSRTLSTVLDALSPSAYDLKEVHCSCGAWGNPENLTANDVDRIAVKGLGFDASPMTIGLVWRTLPEEVAAVRRILDGAL